MSTQITIGRVLVDESYIHAVILGRLGYSYRVIEAETGLSKSKIGAILRRHESQVGNYRNALTPLSQRILKGASPYAVAQAEAKKLLGNGA